ncbi:MAG: hypothetical protein V4498_05610 [candidate division FCPU426 bacterium]
MTPPGDPIEINEGRSEYRQILASYEAAGFVDLENHIEAALVNGIPGENELVWETQMRGQKPRGWIATIESRDDKGRTTVFQVMYVAVNDKRTPVRLTQGIFSAAAKTAFTRNSGGSAVKGEQP